MPPTSTNRVTLSNPQILINSTADPKCQEAFSIIETKTCHILWGNYSLLSSQMRCTLLSPPLMSSITVLQANAARLIFMSLFQIGRLS
ncbi:hypothetical protein QL093DRAFT_2439485 [Fusarium oxysporum]|nr:hypothetical protein QL093DRAFT_2439485 [Fusarium oxysporum]